MIDGDMKKPGRRGATGMAAARPGAARRKAQWNWDGVKVDALVMAIGAAVVTGAWQVVTGVGAFAGVAARGVIWGIGSVVRLADAVVTVTMAATIIGGGAWVAGWVPDGVIAKGIATFGERGVKVIELVIKERVKE